MLLAICLIVPYKTESASCDVLRQIEYFFVLFLAKLQPFIVLFHVVAFQAPLLICFNHDAALKMHVHFLKLSLEHRNVLSMHNKLFLHI